MESAIVIGSAIILMKSCKLGQKMVTKSRKKKLHKLLIQGFTRLDMNLVKKTIIELKLYDQKHSTGKLDKYLLQIIDEFKNNKDKMDINEQNLKLAINDFDLLDTIFDGTDQELNDQEQVIDSKLSEVIKRRKQVILRRNALKQERLAIIKKKQRRNAGGLG